MRLHRCTSIAIYEFRETSALISQIAKFCNDFISHSPNFSYILGILLQTTLHDSKLCVEFKSALKNVVAPRNLEKI